jgi:hypothetical protein
MTKHSPFRYLKSIPDIIRPAVMLYVRFPRYCLHTAHLTPVWHSCPAIGTACVGCKVRLAVRGIQERHLYSRTNFKLNRAAALAEWHQLLSA